MAKTKELSYTQLKKECDPTIFKFKTTKELENFSGVIGQARGIKALEFGVNIDIKGYNIYMEGPTGIGKTIYARNYLQKIAKDKPVPDDWCYIYNFEDPNEPIAVNLPAGLGKKFTADMDAFIETIKAEIKSAFNNQDFEKEKATIEKDVEEKKIRLIDKLNKDAAKQGFEIKNASTGIYFLPMINGKTLSEDEFEALDENTKNEFEMRSLEIQKQTIETMKKIKELEKKAAEKIGSWRNNIALFAVSIQVNELKATYKKFPKIQDFLKNIQKDIINHLNDFISDEQAATPQNMNPMMKNESLKPWHKYKVNLFVDNSNLEGAPVIIDSNPSFYNLFGKLEYENSFGTLKTDFTLIKPGLIHEANGGYIVLQIRDLLSNNIIWDSFKRVLRTKLAYVDTLKDYQMNTVAIASLKPEPIPINVKVILIGPSNIYHQLLNFDEDFKKLFKVKVEFEEEAPRNDNTMNKIAQFIHNFCEKENAPHFNAGAVANVIEYCSRAVENQNKLSTQLNDITELLGEACTWAKMDGARVVTSEYVKKAISERIERINKYDQHLVEMIQNGTIMIDTNGEKVGQINGLSVMKIGDYSFGKPAKITANTYIGKGGIVNIEREVSMSGTSHSKGVMILSAYIGEKFAQEIPLALSASLCFEQMYSGVDGDSASSTELYALLSSLSELPIKQSIAVTGSVTQKGEIQAIGGVTDKIEGFFNICKLRGLTGEQGIIMPHQNIKNLNLSDEVIAAVKDGMFHIYPVKTIDEGIEILTGVPAGKKNKNNAYPAGTVNYLVNEKLKKYAEAAEEYD
ncbi:MAG: AAA family ATPase [Clostridia bacterium]|nr:AAA family ATPase [Clostridia bacterium]